MEYKVGDIVLYNMQGACEVTDIIERDFNGILTLYYVLKPTYDEKSTMYVPVNIADVKLKHILSVDAVYELIRMIPDEHTIWIEDSNSRRDLYRSIIASGDRRELIKLIKTLYLRKQEEKSAGKILYKIEEQLMKDAEQILYEEFAHVLNITREQVVPFMIEQIEKFKEEESAKI